MKTLFVLSILFVLAAPVIAHEAFKGFRCENECPLARNGARRSPARFRVPASILRSNVRPCDSR